MKTCTKCEEEKPLRAFRKRKGSVDGLHGWCKSCNIAYSKAHYIENKEKYFEHFAKYKEANAEEIAEYKKHWYSIKGRDSNYRKHFGITLKQYEELLDKQGGGCAICQRTAEEEGRNLAVDHSHVDGRIRGLLCIFCNKFLVSHHKDGELLKKAGEYIATADTGYVVPAAFLKGPKKTRKKRVNRSRKATNE